MVFRCFIYFFLISVFFVFNNPVFAFSLNKNKKQQKPREKMIETRQEWELEAQNIPLHLRETVKYEENFEEAKNAKTNNKSKIKFNNAKKFHLTPVYIFESYNYPAGSRSVNIEKIKKNLSEIPYFVADSKFQYAAYSRFYFLSEFNQISSAFFVEKLDTSKSRKDRMLDFIHNQEKRTPVFESGNEKIYKNLFNGISLVDWSKDSKKVLFKEKIGSLENGIYKTYLYVHFLEDDEQEAYTIKLDNFDKAIKFYFLDWQKIQIVKYRYDIYPLGFSNDDNDVILSYCFALDNENNKVFLGVWGYNLRTNETILISKEPVNLNISNNGLYLKQIID